MFGQCVARMKKGPAIPVTDGDIIGTKAQLTSQQCSMNKVQGYAFRLDFVALKLGNSPMPLYSDLGRTYNRWVPSSFG